MPDLNLTILHARNYRLLRQRQVQELSGIHPSTLSRLESGKQVITDEILKKLAKAYNTTAAKLKKGVFT